MDAATVYLDSVNWASLRHAFGEASDVPTDLRALVSPEKEDRDTAYERLHETIFHQADRYEASAYAVPYLLQILEMPSTPARGSVISLLVDLALGIPSLSLPQGVDAGAWRARAKKVLAPEYEAEYYAEMDEMVSQAATEHRRKMYMYVREVGLERNRQSLKHELAAYDAVCRGVPVFQQCLREDDAELRAWAAFALAWFPGEEDAGGRHASSAAALLRVLDDEPEDSVLLACVLISLGLLYGCWRDGGATPDGFDNLVPRLREYGADLRRPLVQFAAAAALVRLQRHNLENVSLVVKVLIDRSFMKADLEDCSFPFCEGDLFKYSSKVLMALDLDEYPDVMSTVLEALPHAERIEALELTEVVLELAFGPRPEDDDTRPVESLSAVQRQTVLALAEMPEEFWEESIGGSILGEWNIPSESQDECREYIGL